MLRHVVLVVAALCVVAAGASRVSYRGHKLIDFAYDGDADALEARIPTLDVFKARGGRVRALVDAAALEQLKAHGVEGFKVEIEDMQAHIDGLAAPSGEHVLWTTVGRDSPFFDTFRTYDEISVYVDQLVANYSRILTKFVAGTTYEGRTIYGVKVSNGGANKPTVYFEAQVHAREWLASPTNLFALTSLVEDYTAGVSDVVQLINGLDWYFVPIVNIDGYIYTWSNDRLWRKNRRQNAGGSYGVDINRNWGPANTWCTAGSSTVPTSDTYCGTAPFSEPETRSMGNWIDSLPDLRAAVDFHTYGPLLLHPFQYSYNQAPEPYNGEVIRIGLEMEQAMRGVHGTRFDSIQGSDLYPHSGGLIDYTYFTRGAFAYTIELRGNSFVVPASDIRLSGEETYPAVLILAENGLNNKVFAGRRA